MRTTRVCLSLLALTCAETSTSPAPTTVAPAGEVKRARDNSYSISAADRTIYVKIAQVRSENGESIHAFIRKMFASADSARTQRLVIDLRAISGSDTRLAVPLIKDIATRERFMKRGALFVVVGDESFSPSQSAARLLQEYANPVFVRQPRG